MSHGHNIVATNLTMEQTNSAEIIEKPSTPEIIDISDSDEIDNQSQIAIQFIDKYMKETNKTIKDLLIDKDFLESVSTNFPNISFDAASDVDLHYSGDYGELWRAAYKYPNVGDKINIPLMDDNFAEAIAHKAFIFTIDYAPI